MDRRRTPPSRVDWSRLLPEILGFILRLLALDDRVRFRSVCRSWRAIVASDYTLPGPQLPFLALPGDEAKGAETHHFLDLSDQATHKLVLPARRFVAGGSSDGRCLVTVARTSKIFLLNPFSKRQVQLPSLWTFPDVKGIHRTEPVVGAVIEYLCQIRRTRRSLNWDYMSLRYLTKVVASSRGPEPTKDDFTAVAIYGEDNKLGFCRAGDERWTALESRLYPYADIMYYMGKFYAIGRNGMVEAWDPGSGGGGGRSTTTTTPRVTRLLESMPCISRYIAVSESGDSLLQIIRVNDTSMHYNPLGFLVFRLEARGTNWAEVGSLGENALFLGRCRSVCLPVRGFHHAKGNCIYFLDNDRPWHFASEGKGCAMGEYSLEDGKIIQYSVSIWPPPIWFMPKLSEARIK